jgi:hypothetical protein
MLNCFNVIYELVILKNQLLKDRVANLEKKYDALVNADGVMNPTKTSDKNADC